MKISTAPAENSISLSAKAATPQASGRRHREQQPARAADRDAQHQARPGADAPADAVAEDAGQDGADAHRRVAQAHRLLRQPQGARREQDLHHHGGVVARLPAADAATPARPAAGCARTKRRPALSSAQNFARGLRRAASRAPACRAGSPPRTPAAPRRPASASGAPSSLISAPASARPHDLGARARQRVLGMRLDQPFARHDLGQHDLRGTARRRVDRADQKADDVQPADRQPAQPPGERHARDGQAEHAFAGDVDRELAHAVQPDARRAGRTARTAAISMAVSRPICVGVACSSTAAVAAAPASYLRRRSELMRIEVHRRR